MNLVRKIVEKGLLESSIILWNRKIIKPYLFYKSRYIKEYRNPTDDEYSQIVECINNIGISVTPIALSIDELEQFKRSFVFPDDYYPNAWDEKVLEHFIAYKFCELDKLNNYDIYVDIAGEDSPWSLLLRQNGYKAYTIDLHLSHTYRHLNNYLQGDATNTIFDDSSISACSLQCAYEMFMGNDDARFIDECNRILKPGGKCVISPLYMHTHHCGYATPEYIGKGYADKGAKEYIRRNSWGIRFSRKYDATALKERIIERIIDNGLNYQLSIITNKEELGKDIYCTFILEITKPLPIH